MGDRLSAKVAVEYDQISSIVRGGPLGSGKFLFLKASVFSAASFP